MAPRPQFAKGQEIVYKKLGTGARPFYKPVNAKLQAKTSTQTDPSSSAQTNPSVVVPPLEDDLFGFNEGSSCHDFEIPQRKKKVCHEFLMKSVMGIDI